MVKVSLYMKIFRLAGAHLYLGVPLGSHTATANGSGREKGNPQLQNGVDLQSF